MIYRYIYKITCTKGSFKNKFYYGQHTTNNLNDGYKGSGKLLKDYYKKYPNDYIKEIILYCNTQSELNDAEYNIIKPYLGTNDCLNLKGGGDKGELTKEYKKRISEKLKGTIESRQKQSITIKGHIVKEETRKKISILQKDRPLTEEHKQHLHVKHIVKNRKPVKDAVKSIISNTIKSKGYKWMHNKNTSKQVPQVEQQHYIDNGWCFGRI